MWSKGAWDEGFGARSGSACVSLRKTLKMFGKDRQDPQDWPQVSVQDGKKVDQINKDRETVGVSFAFLKLYSETSGLWSSVSQMKPKMN